MIDDTPAQKGLNLTLFHSSPLKMEQVFLGKG